MQTAIDRHFEGLDGASLPEGARFMCAETVKVPAGVRDLWIDVEDIGPRLEEVLSEAALEAMSVIVVVCNIFDHDQVSHVVRIADWLSADEVAPPAVLLPLRPDGDAFAGKSIFEAVKEQDIVKGSLDDFLFGEPVGSALALAIHACVAKAELRVEQWQEKFRHRSTLADGVRDLSTGLDATMWQYIPQRLHLALPPVDYDLGDHNSKGFAGYTIHQRLAFGADELMYRIEPPRHVGAAVGGEMVKVVPKSTVAKSIDALRRVQRTLQIMQTLSGRWGHPSIARSLQIYHSPSCLYMRMECAGTESLCQRLKARDAGTASIAAEQLRLLVRQLASVIRHLHQGPRICHRDIKPENVALTDSDEGFLQLKLVNFDTAAVQLQGGLCKLKSGTFPFAAPEVADSKYDGMAADMWSLGVLFLEMVCGVGIVERTVCQLDVPPPGAQTRFFPKKAMRRVRDALSDEDWVRRVLSQHLVPELSELRGWFGSTLPGLHRVLPAHRWTSSQLWMSSQASLNLTHDWACGSAAGESQQAA